MLCAKYDYKMDIAVKKEEAAKDMNVPLELVLGALKQNK